MEPNCSSSHRFPSRIEALRKAGASFSKSDGSWHRAGNRSNSRTPTETRSSSLRLLVRPCKTTQASGEKKPPHDNLLELSASQGGEYAECSSSSEKSGDPISPEVRQRSAPGPRRIVRGHLLNQP